jgi:hypothetical protein
MWWNLDESLNCFLYFTNRNFVGNPALLQRPYKNKIGESRVTELQQTFLNTHVLPDDSKYCLNWASIIPYLRIQFCICGVGNSKFVLVCFQFVSWVRGYKQVNSEFQAQYMYKWSLMLLIHELHICMEKVGRSVCCSLLPFSSIVILRHSVDLVHYKMSTLKKNTGKIILLTCMALKSRFELNAYNTLYLLCVSVVWFIWLTYFIFSCC